MNRREFLRAVFTITAAAPLVAQCAPAYAKIPEFYTELCGWQRDFVAAVCEGRPISFHTPMRAGKSYVIRWLREHPEANPLQMLVFERQMSVASVPGAENYPMGWRTERRLVTLEHLLNDPMTLSSGRPSPRYGQRRTHLVRS